MVLYLWLSWLGLLSERHRDLSVASFSSVRQCFECGFPYPCYCVLQRFKEKNSVTRGQQRDWTSWLCFYFSARVEVGQALNSELLLFDLRLGDRGLGRLAWIKSYMLSGTEALSLKHVVAEHGNSLFLSPFPLQTRDITSPHTAPNFRSVRNLWGGFGKELITGYERPPSLIIF